MTPAIVYHFPNGWKVQRIDVGTVTETRYVILDARGNRSTEHQSLQAAIDHHVAVSCHRHLDALARYDRQAANRRRYCGNNPTHHANGVRAAERY